MEVQLPKLRNPRIIIFNVPEELTKENASETIIQQNPELQLEERDISAKFKYRTKRNNFNLVVEVNAQTRKKLLRNKLKIGWSICHLDDYLAVTRCFRCSRLSHTHTNCERDVTCPLCSGNHILKECTTPETEHKCINCITYNSYSKKENISVNHSSLSKDCPSMLATLRKYKINTD